MKNGNKNGRRPSGCSEDWLYPQKTDLVLKTDMVIHEVQEALAGYAHQENDLAIDYVRCLVEGVLAHQPKRTLEVGLGSGYATAHILAAGSPRHTIVASDARDLQKQEVEPGMRNARLFGEPDVLEGDLTESLAALQHNAGTYDFVLVNNVYDFETLTTNLGVVAGLLSPQGLMYVPQWYEEDMHRVMQWVTHNPVGVVVLHALRTLLVMGHPSAEHPEAQAVQ